MGTADAGCGTFRVIGETNSNGGKKINPTEEGITSDVKIQVKNSKIDAKGGESKEGES